MKNSDNESLAELLREAGSIIDPSGDAASGGDPSRLRRDHPGVFDSKAGRN
jgi:hypothetical protein